MCGLSAGRHRRRQTGLDLPFDAGRGVRSLCVGPLPGRPGLAGPGCGPVGSRGVHVSADFMFVSSVTPVKVLAVAKVPNLPGFRVGGALATRPRGGDWNAQWRDSA